MLVKHDGKKDGSKYRFKVIQKWEALRWVHAFFLIIESHMNLIFNRNHVFKKRHNMLQVVDTKDQKNIKKKVQSLEN